ncbi:MAG: nicotinate-nucleotide--dimethylbenzimidazole phosphoribosyltransferase, partial [Pyrinomonadaceae bacterium]|nr:nicotinate-nucleotide--dimethylbenzimidazole phosphoribosyltransferase [Pyrinomonadaceae bacterium]
MSLISSTIKNIAPIDKLWLEKAEARQLDLTKPPRSLGELETIANRLCAIQETLKPSVTAREIFVFAASHGVCDENISPYPSTVTAQMVANFINGGAAINALAKVGGANLTVVDVGVSGADFENVNRKGLRFINSKVCEGTKNFATQAAMSEAEMCEALKIGIELAAEAKRANVEIIGLGEMGIGNTTSASAITSALLGIKPEICTGRGTGANDAMLSHKIETVKRALATNQPQKDDAFDILRKVGGLEIAA